MLRLQRTFGNAAVAGIVARSAAGSVSVQRQTVGELIDKHSGILGSLDEEALGRELAQRLPAENDLAMQVMRALDNSDRDDVAVALTSALSMTRLGSLSEDLRMTLVREMVGGWVTDEDEAQIAKVWQSFGTGLGPVATKNKDLWKKSIEESDQLNELPAVRDVRTAFQKDVIRLARLYLDDNETGARNKGGTVGLTLPGGKPRGERPWLSPATQTTCKR